MLIAQLISTDRYYFLSSIVVLTRIYVWLYIFYLSSVWCSNAHTSKRNTHFREAHIPPLHHASAQSL